MNRIDEIRARGCGGTRDKSANLLCHIANKISKHKLFVQLQIGQPFLYQGKAYIAQSIISDYTERGYGITIIARDAAFLSSVSREVRGNE